MQETDTPLQEAAVKVAREDKLRPDEIRFAYRAYNVSAVNDNREHTKDIREKMADVPTIDVEAVVSELYPSVSAKEASAVSTVYSLPPRSPFPRTGPSDYQISVQRIKAAGYDWAPAGVKQEEDNPEETSVLNTLMEVQAAMKAAELEICRARTEFLGAFGRLKDAFPKTAAAREELLYGAAQLWKAAGEDVVKTAAETLGHKVAYVSCCVLEHPLESTNAFYKAAADVVHARAKLARVIVDRARLGVHGHCLSAAYREKLAGQVPPGLFPREQFWQKAANGVWSYVLGSHLANLGTKELLESNKAKEDSRLKKMQLQLSDPGHETNLRKIRTQAMLHDMMQNDNVLRGYKPTEIAGAFNDISQMSPRLAGQPMLTRSLLRKWLPQGGIDTFEAKDVAETEKLLASTGGSTSLTTGGPA